MTRLLVTGATGFLGVPVVRTAVERGVEVHVVVRKHCEELPAVVRQHTADLFDATAVQAIAREIRPTHLLHLAWITTPGVYWTSPENHTWLAASLELLRAFTEAGGRRAVFTGTCAEYDWNGDGVCHETRSPLSPATVYGTCKAGLCQRATELSERCGVSFAWPRLFFLYGPREHPARLVPTVARGVLAGERVDCTSGEHRRDFLHVSDAADALVSLTLSELAGAVNVGSGVAVALNEVISLTAAAAGDANLVRFGAKPTPPNEPPLLVADTARLRDEVVWRPRIALADGLRQTVGWHRLTR